MKEIEKYIQFWEDNWASLFDEWESFRINGEDIEVFDEVEWEELYTLTLTYTIRKLSFITAIARGYEKTKYMNTPHWVNVEYIMKKQREAIANNTLPEFINNLLNNK